MLTYFLNKLCIFIHKKQTIQMIGFFDMLE